MAAAETNLLRINANGLRTKRRKTFLGRLLVDLKIGVCVVTETHLRKKDLRYLKYDDYVVLADSCRLVPEGDRIAGG